MIESMQNQRVEVKRGGLMLSAMTRHLLYMDKRVTKTGEVVGKGDLLGVGVEITNEYGTPFLLYCKPEDMVLA